MVAKTVLDPAPGQSLRQVMQRHLGAAAFGRIIEQIEKQHFHSGKLLCTPSWPAKPSRTACWTSGEARTLAAELREHGQRRHIHPAVEREHEPVVRPAVGVEIHAVASAVVDAQIAALAEQDAERAALVLAHVPGRFQILDGGGGDQRNPPAGTREPVGEFGIVGIEHEIRARQAEALGHRAVEEQSAIGRHA